MYLLILLKCFDNQIFQNIFEAKPIMIISFLQNFFTLISPLVWELTLLQKTPLYSKNGKSVKHTKNGPLPKFKNVLLSTFISKKMAYFASNKCLKNISEMPPYDLYSDPLCTCCIFSWQSFEWFKNVLFVKVIIDLMI